MQFIVAYCSFATSLTLLIKVISKPSCMIVVHIPFTRVYIGQVNVVRILFQLFVTVVSKYYILQGRE